MRQVPTLPSELISTLVGFHTVFRAGAGWEEMTLEDDASGYQEHWRKVERVAERLARTDEGRGMTQAVRDLIRLACSSMPPNARESDPEIYIDRAERVGVRRIGEDLLQYALTNLWNLDNH